MPEPVLLTDVKIWKGGYAIEGSSNRCGFRIKNAENPDGRFGDVLEAVYPGLIMPTIDAAGFYAAGAGQVDAIVAPRLGLLGAHDKTAWPVTLCPPQAPAAAAGADGNLAYTVEGVPTKYEIGDAHGKSLPFTLNSVPRSTGRVHRGRVALPKLLRTGTATGTALDLGAVSAAQQIVCVLHVFAVDGGSWVLTVESDDNSGFATPVTRLTLAAATALTFEVKKLAGAITDNWWRVVLTKTGGTSCTAAALLAISPL